MPHSADLRRQVEDLAVRVVVEDTAGGAAETLAWLSNLERIRQLAATEKAGEVADAATAMMTAIQAGADAQEGLARLQQALEMEASDGNVLPPSQDPELLADFVLESREHLGAIETR